MPKDTPVKKEGHMGFIIGFIVGMALGDGDLGSAIVGGIIGHLLFDD